MATYRVEYASPGLIDSLKWTTHHAVTHQLAKAALKAARGDAKELRKHHKLVRFIRES